MHNSTFNSQSGKIFQMESSIIHFCITHKAVEVLNMELRFIECSVVW